MSRINKVVNYLGRITNGVTRPVKVQADNGISYVMKFLHPECTSKILYNELIAYRLGIILEIPMPNCVLGMLENDVICKSDDLMNMEAVSGTCFLSEYRAGTANISPIIVKNIVNASEISKILIFDQLILNNDRAKNNGNLYYDKKYKKLLAIDHSHIFINGEVWTSYELSKLRIESPKVVTNLFGRNYRIFSEHLLGHSCYTEMEKKIKSLKKVEIQNLFSDIPEDWNISEEDIKCSFELVWEQMNQIEGIIKQLQDVYSVRKGGKVS